MGQSTARDPGTNSSAAATTNTELFAWYRGTDRVEGEREGDEMRGKGERRVTDGRSAFLATVSFFIPLPCGNVMCFRAFMLRQLCVFVHSKTLF